MVPILVRVGQSKTVCLYRQFVAVAYDIRLFLLACLFITVEYPANHAGHLLINLIRKPLFTTHMEVGARLREFYPNGFILKRDLLFIEVSHVLQVCAIYSQVAVYCDHSYKCHGYMFGGR